MPPSWYNATWEYVKDKSFWKEGIGAWRLTMVETELKNPNKFWLRYERSGQYGVPTCIEWHDVTLEEWEDWTFLGMATSRDSFDKFPDSIVFWTKWERRSLP